MWHSWGRLAQMVKHLAHKNLSHRTMDWIYSPRNFARNNLWFLVMKPSINAPLRVFKTREISIRLETTSCSVPNYLCKREHSPSKLAVWLTSYIPLPNSTKNNPVTYNNISYNTIQYRRQSNKPWLFISQDDQGTVIQ